MPRFRILVGQHAEKDDDGALKIYSADGSRAGNIIDSKSDLLRLNSPGSIKFERVDRPRGHAEAKAESRSVAGPPGVDKPDVSAAPGGQVSTGFQRAPNTIEGNVSGIHQAAQPTAEQVRAATGGDDEGDGFDQEPQGSASFSKTELQSFTVEELHGLASEHGYNLHGASRKDDIIDAIVHASKKK